MRAWLALTLLACGLYAQNVSAPKSPQPSADAADPTTRAGEIELQRKQKATHLSPDTPGPIDNALQIVSKKRIVDRVTNGIAGFRLHLGGLITGSGMALGPEYYRRDLAHEQLLYRASARGSLRKFYLVDTEISDSHLAGGRASADLYAAHSDYPNVDYYGPSANSVKTGRSGFSLEQTSFRARAAVSPAEHFHAGLVGSYLMFNVGPGRDDRFVSTDVIYTERTTPGIQVQSDFGVTGAFVQYDWRDNPGGPRHGGNYRAQFARYSDIERGLFSFNSLDLEAQQYIPFFNQRRVIALRGRLQATDALPGQVVPFYLQPTLGGSDDLRGFRSFRFYGNDSLVLNGEYRWEVFSGLDMALFMDAGRVFPNFHSVSVNELETDYGFGFRFNVRNDVFLRIDTGFSHEGFQVWFKFSNVF
ncbi:MAG TPA: BamA/TamA family outer membrane protein [Bryobacteraceae bacterium]|nr:BamA/TamA family outer membrane protein [Bryobacteraceae bacterium]